MDSAHEMSQEQMKIRNSTLIFRTSSQAGSVEGIDIGALFLDEYDRVGSMAEASAMESMKSSEFGLLRRWSTPTALGYGIHKLYESSDKRAWLQKCPHCGERQKLDYNVNVKQVGPDSGIDLIGKVILPGTFEFVCRKCGKPLDRWYGGEWVATAPSKGRAHGYAISQMDACWITADQLKTEEMRYGSKQEFYNYVLGVPYEDNSTKFVPSDVLDNLTYDRNDRTREDYSFLSVGIDWGTYYHHLVFIGLTPEGKLEIVKLIRVPVNSGAEHIEEDIGRVVSIIREMNPDIIIPDMGFSANGAYIDILRKYFGSGRVYGVKTRTATSNGDPVAHFTDGNGTVTIDKLTQVVMMMGNMRRGGIGFYKPMDENLKLFIQHWENVIIRTDEEEDSNTGEIRHVKRIMRKGDDHFALSSTYSMMGITQLLNLREQNRQAPLSMSYLEDNVISQEPTDFVKNRLNYKNSFETEIR